MFGSGRHRRSSARYRRGDGRFVDAGLGRVPAEEVLAGLPVREFRSWRGRKHYSGWYRSATTGGHVVYESRLELVRILLADQDPDDRDTTRSHTGYVNWRRIGRSSHARTPAHPRIIQDSNNL